MSDSAQLSFSTADLTRLKKFLIGQIERELEAHPVAVSEHKNFVHRLITQALQTNNLKLPPTVLEQVTREILDEILEFGILQPLLDDNTITEVMVNGPNSVYIERDGKLVKTNLTFENDEAVYHLIDRIILPLGRRVDTESPTVDARLPDGSRVNAIIPPVAIDGPSITIRKFSKGKLKVEQLIEYGTLTKNMAFFMSACVISRLNIIISGGTGSGKTTLLNVLSGYIPEEERIITIEDAAELKLQQDHVVRLETKPSDVEGKNSVPIRELVRNSLRMRPDRIIVGEVRGGEALDMLQAMNTGHDGSLTTLHANSPRDAISRLETMVLMAGMDLPIKVIREQVASAIDLIIQVSRLRDGSRKIIAITEVSGMEGDTVTMTDIFKFEQSGVSQDGRILGEIKPTGIRPLFINRLETAGFKLGPDIFGTNFNTLLQKQRR